MRRGGLLREQVEESSIDITPMLDVVFILLIFFIVTASFIKEPGLQVNKTEMIHLECHIALMDHYLK